jgi:hypothetical protein
MVIDKAGMRRVYNGEPAVLPEGLAYHSPNARDGATFILDEAADLEARWGRGGEVLWARGESLVIAAPPGVGKTTLAGQIVAGLIGITPDVLGYPITPATRVLYLAMDRPRQIRRALRRLFTEEHREQLAEHLVVRPGPIPSDLGNKPELLLDLVCSHGCDVVVLDSLKDAAVHSRRGRAGRARDDPEARIGEVEEDRTASAGARQGRVGDHAGAASGGGDGTLFRPRAGPPAPWTRPWTHRFIHRARHAHGHPVDRRGHEM